VVYEGAFGSRHGHGVTHVDRHGLPHRLDGQTLTSIAALQLVIAALKLDEPAGTIDPALASAQVLTGFDAKGIPQLRSAQSP
jgi:hypothetical protein